MPISLSVGGSAFQTAFLRRLAHGSSAFLAVWRRQLETKASFGNGERHIARLGVLIGHLAEVGVLSGIGGQPLLEVGVVGTNLDKGVGLVKENFRGLVSLVKSCFHFLILLLSGIFSQKVSIFQYFARLLTWEKQRFSNRKRPDDALLIQGVSVG